MNAHRSLDLKAIMLRLMLAWISLSAFNAYATGTDRLGFQSPTGFNTLNNVQTGWAGYAYIGHIRPDDTQDISVPVTVTSTNPALLVVTKLPQPVLQGTLLVNYRLSVPVGAQPGSADINASMTYNGTTYTRARSFKITVAASGNPVPATVVLQPAPPADPQDITAARFLEQATFGPDQNSLALVKQLGIDAWLNDQLLAPETAIADGLNTNQVAAVWFGNMASAPDQLRQRLMFALSQVFVVSRNKNVNGDELIPWLRLLSKNAFGNYFTLMKDVTLSPTMGKYLDLANSVKPTANNQNGANENFPRELLQLFTLGLYQLNQDGSVKTDVDGIPLNTYSQTTIQQLALALSGWTYPTAPGKTPATNNWEYFVGQMEPRDQNHDKSAKVLFGGTPNAVSLPAGMSVQQELDVALKAVFNHPNLPPFVATRLIRSLVSSNPSPLYIKNVADVFVDNGQGVRGDLTAVIRAVLTDPEARQDVADTTQGRLKDPILHILGMTRALGAQLVDPAIFQWELNLLGQAVFAPSSVFSFYSPLHHLPDGSGLFGPEFQIYTPSQAILRANMLWGLLGQTNSSWVLNITTYISVAGDPNALIDLINSRLFQGRMSPELRKILFDTALFYSDLTQRSRTLLYLAAISSEYAVHR